MHLCDIEEMALKVNAILQSAMIGEQTADNKRGIDYIEQANYAGVDDVGACGRFVFHGGTQLQCSIIYIMRFRVMRNALICVRAFVSIRDDKKKRDVPRRL